MEKAPYFPHLFPYVLALRQSENAALNRFFILLQSYIIILYLNWYILLLSPNPLEHPTKNNNLYFVDLD
jgi:hypothetical protein